MVKSFIEVGLTERHQVAVSLVLLLLWGSREVGWDAHEVCCCILFANGFHWHALVNRATEICRVGGSFSVKASRLLPTVMVILQKLDVTCRNLVDWSLILVKLLLEWLNLDSACHVGHGWLRSAFVCPYCLRIPHFLIDANSWDWHRVVLVRLLVLRSSTHILVTI